MHLIYENVLKLLIGLWTGDGAKGLDTGREDYELSKAVWEAIGQSTAAAGSTIPSVYGSRVPNVAQDRSLLSAEMWAFWGCYIAPTLLRQRFTQDKYYRHFVRLVCLINVCLQFEITKAQVGELRKGLAAWVVDFERIYYQHDPQRAAVCTLNVHALLHIADSIELCGPVWCYWAFPMERYCCSLQPALRSRRFPWASLDRFVVEQAQLTQVKWLYNIAEELRLAPPPRRLEEIADDTCILLPPRRMQPLAAGLANALVGALSTRFDVTVKRIRQHLRFDLIEEYGRVRRIDSTEGDTICAASMRDAQMEDGRDASYVRYEAYVDKNQRQKKHAVKLQLRTFYGQLQHLLVVHFPEPCLALHLTEPQSFIFAAIRQCKVNGSGLQSLGLDVRFYSEQGPLDVVDIMSVQCLVGRIYDRGQWAIIDRSGDLVRAVPEDDDGSQFNDDDNIDV
ncbi:hypothetical protein FISHEDRAFT_37513 [Fistulina hepatica ATCC 64428]|uniref:DUF4218 domain-containing protein n=1 Tax=Fistulina hepatica ATCC 64428 TaxID=1128425 RepID=A0A0D7AKQ3_9AGAR|nr:hypothetical protein FISHEDRAFT_37513 [Fistulina hepatica ATCC 64428]